MKTNRLRHDVETQFLFKQELLLRIAFERKAWTDVDGVLEDLREQLYKLQSSGIANSKGLDHFLQVAMAWLATYLGRRAKEDTFRATVSLYHPKLEAILVKPCLVYPGRCTPPQPTISLEPVPETEPKRKTKAKRIGFRGAIGHTGLAMALGQILYCRPVARHCKQYIKIEAQYDTDRTKAALCIPLEGDFQTLREDFNKGRSEGSDRLCSHHDECQALHNEPTVNPIKGKKGTRFTVLNIECTSNYLTDKAAIELLADERFSQVVEKVIETLAQYREQRDTHRAMEHCSTLLALATNTLNPRSAYRALLREISAACDGADVTLHLRDLFEEANEKRCSLFVTGVGSNFRDFLINERIGLDSGQIGWALREYGSSPPPEVSGSTLYLTVPGAEGERNVRVQYIVGKEIIKSLAGENTIPFKQLMPNTFLNATVPVYFHDHKIGVINIEWDEAHLRKGYHAAGLENFPDGVPSEGRAAIEEYLKKCLLVVYRMADYFSLVIDYFDDTQYLANRPNATQLSQETFVVKLKREGALRKIMRYYMERGMVHAQAIAQKEKNGGETFAGSKQQKKDEAERLCLKDLVDAVGYSLASTHNLRILVSVRRWGQDDEGPVLRHHVSHWLEGPDADEEARKGPIHINRADAVLAAAASHGVALFGTIEDEDPFQQVQEGERPAQQLRLDELCKKLIKDPLYPQRPSDTVRYRRAGPRPRYEVGVPLVFGRSMLGTFDFEQFEQETPIGNPPKLDERDLCAHLEWGRAIAFLIAYIEDEMSPIVMSEGRLHAFKRFQALCVQLIAEVPVDHQQLVAIATDAIGEIVPVKDANVESLPIQITEERRIDLLRFRGEAAHALSWKYGDPAVALLNWKAESDPGRTVTAMMTSYHSLIRNLSSQDPEGDDFIGAITQIEQDMEREHMDLTDPSCDAGEAALKVFSFLHKSLSRHLPWQAKEDETDPLSSRYAWFLHVRCFDPGKGPASFTCDVGLPRQKKERLAYCYTDEMVKILNETRKANEHGVPLLAALEEVLKSRSLEGLKAQSQDAFDRLIGHIRDELTDKANYQDLINVLTACLARPRVDDPKALSFTLSVARAKRAIVVPSINLSPNRSERGHGWFWKEPYTVLGIPLMLNDECVSVLNVFRRRDSDNDMKFFRIEERDKAESLARKVNDLLAELLVVEPVNRIGEDKLRVGLSRLINELNARAESDAKLFVIQSPFATSRESFKALCDAVFGKDAPPGLQNPVRFPEEDRSFVDQTVVIRVGKAAQEDLLKLGRDLGRITEHALRVYLFVARPEDINPSSVPMYAGKVSSDRVDRSLLQEDSVQEELYYRWLLSRAIMDRGGGKARKAILARPGAADQKWTHGAFRKWLLDRRGASEEADFYAAADQEDASSWRPGEHTFSLAPWNAENQTEKEERQ